MWSLWRAGGGMFQQLETRKKELTRAKAAGSTLYAMGRGGVVRFAATPAAADEHTPHLSPYLLLVGSSSFFRSRQTVASSRPLSSTLSPVDQAGRHTHTHRQPSTDWLTRADPGKSPHSGAGAEKRGDRGCLLTSTAMLRPSGGTCLSERNPRCSGGC